MIENQNAGVTQKKKKYGRLKDFICFSVAAFISFSQVSPIWAAEGTRVFDEAGLFSAEEVQELETRIDEVRDSQDADLAVLTVEDAQENRRKAMPMILRQPRTGRRGRCEWYSAFDRYGQPGDIRFYHRVCDEGADGCAGREGAGCGI